MSSISIDFYEQAMSLDWGAWTPSEIEIILSDGDREEIARCLDMSIELHEFCGNIAKMEQMQGLRHFFEVTG